MNARTLKLALLLGLSAGATAPLAIAQAAGSPGNLPAGHPAIPTNDGGLPAGHPQTPAPAPAPADVPSAMPPGYSPVQSAPKPVAHGSLSLHAAQGTVGGSSAAGDTILVDLYSSAPAPQHFEGKLDAAGIFNIPDINSPSACRPAIKLTHAGIDYQGVGEKIEASNAKQKIEIRIYDTTATMPQWTIKMRHLVFHRSPAGLDVTDMLMLESPADRIWVGADAGKIQHITLDLPLPAGATNVQLSDGFRQGAASYSDGHVVNTAPLFPGQTQLKLTYTLPVDGGKSHLTVAAPAAVGHLMMFVPDDGSNVIGDGLIPAGSGAAPGGTMRFFMVPSMPAGSCVKVDFDHLAAPTTKAAADSAGDQTASVDAKGAESGAAAAGASHSAMPKIIGVGSAALLVGGTIAIFARPAAGKHS